MLTYRAKLENSNTNDDQTGDITQDKSLIVRIRTNVGNVQQTITNGTLGQNHNEAWKTNRTNDLSASEYRTVSFQFTTGTETDYHVHWALQPDATGSRVLIDQASLQAGVLSNQEFKAKNNFNYAPNPTNSIINLSASKNIEKVEFFSILGQKVLSAPVNRFSKPVNISSLQNGMYLMHVTIDNAVGTYRIIKK